MVDLFAVANLLVVSMAEQKQSQCALKKCMQLRDGKFLPIMV